MTPDPINPSPAVNILKNALTQVEDVLKTANESFQLLQNNLQQVTNQRIGLTHQRAMLQELISQVQNAESK